MASLRSALQDPAPFFYLQSVAGVSGITSKTTHMYADESWISDGGTSFATVLAVRVISSTGHLHTFRYGAPNIGELDVILFNPRPFDTVISTPVSTGGAAWTLKTFQAGHYYGAYRVATGGEPATVTLNTADNVPVLVTTTRWR
jgi:hypothetical protein